MASGHDFHKTKEFYKKTGRKLHFDAKEPVGFNKSKVECFNFHNTRHFSKECRSKINQDNRRRDAGNTGYKARDNGKRPAKQDEHKASQMSTKDKSGLGYGSHIHDGVLGYENKVFASVFDSRSGDVEDSHVNDRFKKVKGIHVVPPPMTGNYMPHKSNFGIDESNFTYGPKHSTTSESDAKTSDLDSCESSSSKETLKTVPKPIESKPKVVNKPKVWTDSPIIEEYEPDSDDEHVTIPSKEQEKPSFAFVNTVEHVTPPRKTAKEQNTHIPHQTLKGKGIVDSGCSRKMTRNKAYLVDYQDFNGGPVAFEGSKGQITGKGKITTGKLDFEDVYFVKELQHFNPFSVSQMCDKKNKVLFTDTECFVLSHDFKLPDENQVLLRVPRQHNMYSFNLENIVSSGGAARASSTNYVNTARTPVNAASTPLNTASTPTNQDDSHTPSLEDIYEVLRDEIFTSASYDKEGVVAKFRNLETTMNVSPIPTLRIHSIHPTTQILKDQTLAVQTRSKVNKSSRAYGFKEIGTKWVYKNKKNERGVVVRNKARFQVTPKTSHLQAMKRIFRYLKGQPKLGLWYLRESAFALEAFSDNNYARANLDRKSTT
nr:ribonuclease H-like domain-containing protein [Tanacetum cinerariifolium]